MRDPAGAWYGFSNRARIIVYNKATIDPKDVATYASLAEPRVAEHDLMLTCRQTDVAQGCFTQPA